MTNKEVVQAIKSAVGDIMLGGEMEDIFWAITTNPDLVMEVNRRYADWCREMNETHPDR